MVKYDLCRALTVEEGLIYREDKIFINCIKVVMEIISCPNCGNDNPVIRFVDDEGTHYECPNCFHEWVVPHAKTGRDGE